MKNAREFVLEFYNVAEFGCLEYCDKGDVYSIERYDEYYNKRATYREMLLAIGFTWDAIDDLDTRLAAEYARKHA